MPNRIITAQIQGEYIKLSSGTAGAAGSHNAVSLEISFDEAWADTSRKVYFISADGADNACVLLTTDLLKEGETDVYVLPIPSEGLASAGEMTLTVKGYHIPTGGTTADRVIMSASTRMTVLKSDLPSADNEPTDVTPTQAEQLQGEVDSIKGQIGGAAAAAAAAKASADAAAQSATAASNSATAAANSAAAAAASESASGTNAAAAASSAQAAATAKAAAESAQSAAETAQAAAEAAKSAAETAKTAAETAQGKAETAESNAEAAKAAAQNAQSLAETAKTAAQGAATAAQAAQTAAQTAKMGAETAASNAGASADESEAWASGTIGGVAVPSTHLAYHNNSKYYKDQAQAIVGGDYATKSDVATAKGEAISTAADDATAKANAAQAASDPSGTAGNAVSAHNSASNAHSTLFAGKADIGHTHPDKQDKITASGILKGTGDGGVSVADAAALKTLLDTLSAVSPATGDKIPLTDISDGVVGFSTIADILKLVTPGAQIATGSYTGTGTYGVDNPCSLTFPFTPRMLIITSDRGLAPGGAYAGWNANGTIWTYGSTQLTSTVSSSTYVYFTLTGTTLSWYCSLDADAQYNYSGKTYYYVALG